ncbi:MAG: hypothetical protein A2041_07355 [Bacteroidetes bacterium GWA2_31_9b]|nr:MAG: hypothetical protein A2041_07355 [Bacteroidetes bacterium GWA2_31_9b]
MDFTLKTYKKLLDSLLNQGFSFQTFCEYIEKPFDKTIVLRHDVDKLPENSLQFAQIQHKLGIKGSYYFRLIPESFNPEIIEKIARLGHEIGYHYEDIDFASKSIEYQVSSIKTQDEKEKIIAEKAIELFEKHLAELRKYYPVKTICMHGSPLSKYDNKLVWKYYNYRDFGITGEPYFDVDFNSVLYLTDTGRRWDGDRVSIRDKVKRQKSQDKSFKNTLDIIKAVEKRELPNQIMFTFHPQRWSDKPIPWVKEIVLQNVKNLVKRMVLKLRRE